MQIGDVFYVKKNAYGDEWNGWPMVVEDIYDNNRIRMRYQNQSDGSHNTITYSLDKINEHLEKEVT